MAGRQADTNGTFGNPPDPGDGGGATGAPKSVTLPPIGVPYVLDASGAVIPYAASVTGTEAETQTKRAGTESTQRSVNYQVPAHYFSGDQFAPASWPPGEIAAYQQQLVAAGLLKRGSYQNSVWDPPTIAAYEQLLGAANASGLEKEEMLSRYMQAHAADPNAGKTPLTKQVSSLEELRPAIRKAFIDTLGYGISQDEVDHLAAQFQQLQSSAQQQQYDMQDTGGTVTAPPSAEAFATAKAREQDPTGAQEHDTLGFIDQFRQMVGGWQGG